MSRPLAKWEFGYAEIAKACGVGENAIRQHVSRGNLRPDDLISVVCFIASLGTEEVRKEVFAAMTRSGAYSYGCESGAPRKEKQTRKAKVGINRVQ